MDLVHLASEIGAAGIDLDYEEFWHADAFKTVDPSGTAAQGPWLLHQTVYKYAAIAKDLITAIESISPTLKMSTAASAAGAWEGKWWGGNLKGLWLELNTQFPAIVDFMTKGANAGGLNIMTYDLRCAQLRRVTVTLHSLFPANPHHLTCSPYHFLQRQPGVPRVPFAWGVQP